MTRGAQLLRRSASLLKTASGPGADTAHELAGEIERHLLEPVVGSVRTVELRPREVLSDHDRQRIEAFNEAGRRFRREILGEREWQ